VFGRTPRMTRGAPSLVKATRPHVPGGDANLADSVLDVQIPNPEKEDVPIPVSEPAGALVVGREMT